MATVELQLGESYLKTGSVGARASVDSGGEASVLDASTLDITGDIDIRVDVTAYDWTPPSSMILAAKWLNTGNQRSWCLLLDASGALQLVVSADGTFSAPAFSVSSAVGAANGSRKAVRVTLDVNNGLGGRTATFYTADTLAGPWTALSTDVDAGTTSIFSGTAQVTLATCHGGQVIFTDSTAWQGRVHGFELYSGIGGTRVAALDLTDLAPGTESVDDFEGNIWMFFGTSVITRDWVDVTAKPVYERAPIEISRGRQNEASSAEASRCSFELNNRSGDFSPRNPTGAYYGRVGRNTPVRVSVDSGTSALLLHRQAFDFTFARDSAGLSVTGDIDIRVDLALTSWEGLYAVLAAKYLASGQHSWWFFLDASGALRLLWSTDGTNDLFATSTQPVPLPHHGRKAVRVTLDVNNGAGGRTLRFYTADTLAGSWTQLGDAVVQAGTTSIFDSTAEVRICGYSSAYTGTAHAVVHGAEIRNGIAGSLVASPDFTAAANGATSLTDAQGNLWELAGTAEITNADRRFAGEASDWPPTWDLSGVDQYVPVQAAGVMRRLGQGASPLQSTLRRGLTSLDPVVAYWPCEDGDDSRSIASGLSGAPPMAIFGEPGFGDFDGFKCSLPIPTLSLSGWTGQVPAHVGSGEWQAWFLMAVPAGGVAADAPVIRLWAGNATAPIWQLQVEPSGNLRLYGFSGALAVIADSGSAAFAVNGRLLRVSIGIEQDGSDVNWYLHVLEVGATSGSFLTGTLAAASSGQCFRVDVNHERTMDDVAVGHISVHREIVSLFDLSDELNAYLGETAGERIRRLCDEEAVDVAVVGSVVSTTELGYQLPKPLLDLLTEAADADGGLLHEPRGWIGIAYRTRASMYSQDAVAGAALELDYAANHLREFHPVDDDRATRNDVTVSRIGGGSSRQVLQTGRLSVQPPPAGVGRYDDAPSLSLETDAQTAGQVGWRLHLGTVDEARHPSVGVELARALFAADDVLRSAALALDVGDLLVVTNPPAGQPPDDVAQLVQGHAETIRTRSHRLVWYCAPASPWQVGLYEETGSRYSPFGSWLASPATSSATSLSVRTPAGPLWGTADLPYGITVGGERMTVTAVSGASSPQTITVTRAVNGVSKVHRAGAAVELARPVYYGL